MTFSNRFAAIVAASALFGLLILIFATSGSNELKDESSLALTPAVAKEPPVKKAPRRNKKRVVIVGAGISGLCAALELGRSGAAVTVVDMASVFGGHAVMSQGGVTCIDTELQRQAGIKDSPDLAYKDFIQWGEDAHPEWVRYYVDHSNRDIFEWLRKLGVRFDKKIDTAPGNSVDRFHQPSDRGIGLVTPIYRACLELPNIQFTWNTKAEQLVQVNGRVSGVQCRNLRTNRKTTIHATAVVLATGGFQSNLDMVREFWPREFKFPKRILAGSGRHSVGLGHRMAQKVGAELVKMDHQWNYFTGIPDPRQPNTNRGLSAANMYGIIVNPQGRRFANLHGWAKEVMPPLLKQKNVTLWFVFDEATKKEFVVSGSDWAEYAKVDELILQNKSLVKVGKTWAELARNAGLPAKQLEETIARYNQLVKEGKDRDFGRFGPNKTKFNNSASPALLTPPFYAMQAYPLTRKSMGGVAIDLKCRVLTKKKQVIPGLYAVGELTGLALINGKAALEGTFLGPCVLTGRVAAKSIIAKSKFKPIESQSASCRSCHDKDQMLAKNQAGLWHFEKVHQRTEQLRMDCRSCHSELSPYRENSHKMKPLSLTTTCTHCHLKH